MIQQNECVLQLNLINLKMFYLIKKNIRHKMKRIQSKKHKLGTYEIDKISLSYFDDKRYVLGDYYRDYYYYFYYYYYYYYYCEIIEKIVVIENDCDKIHLVVI